MKKNGSRYCFKHMPIQSFLCNPHSNWLFTLNKYDPSKILLIKIFLTFPIISAFSIMYMKHSFTSMYKLLAGSERF